MRNEPNGGDRLLAGLRPPEPSGELQEEVLRAAREALAREAARDAWTRVWESRPLRVAWASAVVVLVACNIGVTELRSGRARSEAENLARSGRQAGGDGSEFGRLPRLDERVRPLIGASAYSQVEEGTPRRPASAKGKESAS